jgi:hypothetical protein
MIILLINSTKSMAQKYKREATAHARAGRAATRLEATASVTVLPESDNLASWDSPPGVHETVPIFVDLGSESESDCGYTGAINYDSCMDLRDY